MKRETLCPVYFFGWQQPDVNRSHQLRQRTLQDKGNDQQTSFVVRNCSVVIFYLIQCLPLSLFFSWLLRQKERLCNPESFWTPLSKKTKVKIQWFSENELNLNWLNYSIWKTGDFVCSVPYVCSPCSCLWDHNGFWQICPNCHSCQQTQVEFLSCP